MKINISDPAFLVFDRVRIQPAKVQTDVIGFDNLEGRVTDYACTVHVSANETICTAYKYSIHDGTKAVTGVPESQIKRVDERYIVAEWPFDYANSNYMDWDTMLVDTDRMKQDAARQVKRFGVLLTDADIEVQVSTIENDWTRIWVTKYGPIGGKQ